MWRSLFLVLSTAVSVVTETPTYVAVGPFDSPAIAALHRSTGSEKLAAIEQFWIRVKRSGSPLIEPASDVKSYSYVTFLWRGNSTTRNIVIFDGVAGFDANDRMHRLDQSDIWYKTYKVRNDARFAYNLSPNDPLTSFDEIKGDAAMRDRLAMLQIDPMNPHRCPTTFGAYGAESSFVELPQAPPLAWNAAPPTSSKGKVHLTKIRSRFLKGDKKIWIYTPIAYAPNKNGYPLLILFDGDRNVMWIPTILDNLIAAKQIPPTIAVLIDDSVPSARRAELPASPLFADFLASELVPWSQENYHASKSAKQIIVAGSSYGGLAAVYAGLRHPEIFGNVVSLSGSFWWKPDVATEGEWHRRLVTSSPKLPLRFSLEVGLMEGYSMQIAANQRMRDALTAKGYPIRYSEFNGGHSFLTWSGGMANSLIFFLGPKAAFKK